MRLVVTSDSQLVQLVLPESVAGMSEQFLRSNAMLARTLGRHEDRPTQFRELMNDCLWP
jgi:hypothetical protein